MHSEDISLPSTDKAKWKTAAPPTFEDVSFLGKYPAYKTGILKNTILYYFIRALFKKTMLTMITVSKCRENCRREVWNWRLALDFWRKGLESPTLG